MNKEQIEKLREALQIGLDTAEPLNPKAPGVTKIKAAIALLNISDRLAATGGMRDRFEAWARGTAQFVTLKGAAPEGKPWRYFDDEAQDAWEAWQAATEAAKPQEGDIPPPRYSYSADGKTVTLENYDDMMEGLRRYRAEAAKATGTAGELPPKQNLTLDNAPIGTMAPSINGGAWYRTECGWKWNNGSTFPRPGGDWNGELIAPTEAARQPAPVVARFSISEAQKNVIRRAADALEGLDYEDLAGDLRAVLPFSKGQP